MSEKPRPAWSAQFSDEALQQLQTMGPVSEVTREWAWGGSSGAGVRVAVVDSGIEPDHPAVGNRLKGAVSVEMDPAGTGEAIVTEDDPPQDLCGHGTACAGIIHSLAPDAELYSIRVLGRDLKGKGTQFAAGLRWAIEHQMHVINLSLSTSRAQYFGLFHDLADKAYFQNIILVSAANNFPVPSYPSLYSSVISVAAHDEKDPFTYFYNPTPPVEFGAPGIDLRVAWREKSYVTTTGNSFAAPHIAGIVTLIRALHPDLTPFQMKTVLYACASNIHAREE
jgi:subtilisin